MRVTTALNRMLALPRAWVRDVAFGSEGVIVTVALRPCTPVCSGCGARGLSIKEHRVKRWRHLDLGASRCHVECRLRRLYCPGCGDVYEQVPWARAGSRYTRDFEDVVAFLAQQMAKTPVTKLMRIGWRSVGKILARVVADKLDRGRLDGLVMIGCDEVSYGAEHRFLTCVANHDTGGVVWAAPGRNAQTLQGFFDELTDEQRASIRAVSIDMSAGYEKAIRAAVPDALSRSIRFTWCSSAARPPTRSAATSTTATADPQPARGSGSRARATGCSRTPPTRPPSSCSSSPRSCSPTSRMYRAFLLLGELRYLYRLPKEEAAERLDAWLAWASRSRAEAVRQARPDDPQSTSPACSPRSS